MDRVKRPTTSIFVKILFVYAGVLVIEFFLFLFSLNMTSSKLAGKIANLRLGDYLDNVVLLSTKLNNEELVLLSGQGIDVILIEKDKEPVYEAILNEYVSDDNIMAMIGDVKAQANPQEIHYNTVRTESKGNMFFAGVTTPNGDIFIGLATDTQLNDEIFRVFMWIILFYIIIFVIGAWIVIIWVASLVLRINRLSKFISEMPTNNFRNIYMDTGDDEIMKLSVRVDNMRRRIIRDESMKEEILQNVSHDLKTPIAVVKSYAEAIGDGVEDITATEVILEQCDKLEKKVKEFIEYNKLEKLGSSSTGYANVMVKEIIYKIVDERKHIAHIQFVTKLDNSTFFVVRENFYTVCENIVENALRYAKEKIVITLKNEVLTFYNDGEHIDQHFIDEGFKPYAKGSKGKFGLGMSIVVRTLSRFQLELMVENLEVGVQFTIKKVSD